MRQIWNVFIRFILVVHKIGFGLAVLVLVLLDNQMQDLQDQG